MISFLAFATQRPKGGYCITTNHDFSPEKLCGIQGNLWKVLLSIALFFNLPFLLLNFFLVLPLTGMFNF
jgi:hypothetical protein